MLPALFFVLFYILMSVYNILQTLTVPLQGTRAKWYRTLPPPPLLESYALPTTGVGKQTCFEHFLFIQTQGKSEMNLIIGRHSSSTTM